MYKRTEEKVGIAWHKKVSSGKDTWKSETARSVTVFSFLTLRLRSSWSPEPPTHSFSQSDSQHPHATSHSQAHTLDVTQNVIHSSLRKRCEEVGQSRTIAVHSSIKHMQKMQYAENVNFKQQGWHIFQDTSTTPKAAGKKIKAKQRHQAAAI